MRFQNVKPEELAGPIKLPGFSEWAKKLPNGSSVTSVLLASLPGTGKGSAIGAMAESMKYDVVRCRLSQLLEYPDPIGEFRAMLVGTEHLHRTVLWLDGVDRFLARLPSGPAVAQQTLQDWLHTEREPLTRNEVVVVATARDTAAVPAPLADSFDRTFSA